MPPCRAHNDIMSDISPNPETRIALFQRKEVRRTIHNNEWWFVIVDVVTALTDSADPQGYVKDMRRRDPELAKGWGQIATPLSIATAGGPQNLNCANTEGLFRIIQSEATFGLTPSQYAEFKRLKRENLRDHITDLELIFSMLGEAATTEITRTRDAQGFPENKRAARAGGTVAGNARRELEKKSGRKVVTSDNYLALTQSAKKTQGLTETTGKRRAT